MGEYVAKCRTGRRIIERGALEACDNAIEDHDRSHETSVLEVATDGGHEIDPTAWYVLDSSRDAVVSGPHDAKPMAEDRARGEGIDHLIVDGEALRSITGETRLVWQTGDVDIVTDGGQITDAENEKRKRASSGPTMERVSFRLPSELLGVVDAAVERGTYPNRLAALRAAVRQQFPQPDGGHPPGSAGGASTPGTAQPTSDPTPADTTDAQWRLRYHVGELAHYTAWTSEFATVENLYHQYRQGEYGHDVTIERRAEVSADG